MSLVWQRKAEKLFFGKFAKNVGNGIFSVTITSIFKRGEIYVL